MQEFILQHAASEEFSKVSLTFAVSVTMAPDQRWLIFVEHTVCHSAAVVPPIAGWFLAVGSGCCQSKALPVAALISRDTARSQKQLDEKKKIARESPCVCAVFVSLVPSC